MIKNIGAYKKIIIPFLLLFSVVFTTLIGRRNSTPAANRFAEVEKGRFEISVSSTGELVAEHSIDLKGPMLPGGGSRRGHGRGRRIRASNLKILDLVQEGTMVNKGDYVAQLDRTNFDNILKDELENLKTIHTDFDMKILDTAVVLADLRNDIKNQIFAVEVAKITLEQSKYEPPATIRQAEISLDKEQRNLKQKRKNYSLVRIQKEKEIDNLRLDLEGEQRLVDDLQKYLEGFTITSPARGMVIYKREWNGKKRQTGSNVNPWDMVVATLPDLTSMLSKTYISELDINKVKNGQKVMIRVDAFPDKMYTGKVISLAKIGEQLPNSDTKVFEVLSRLDLSDPGLRPSMTSSNKIIIKSFENVVYVPLDCVHTDADGYSYVYTKDHTKQVVKLGESNDKNIIVEEGLNPGKEIYISTPENPWKFKIAGENLIHEGRSAEEKQMEKNLSD
jgi:multidrug efflux pump subunit AcrA (membrane-fusion protein)